MIDYEFIKKLDIEFLKRLDLSVPLRFAGIIPYIERLAKGYMFFEGKESGLLETDKHTIIRYCAEFNNLTKQVQVFQVDPAESGQSTANRKNDLVERIKKIDVSYTTYVLPIYLRVKAEEDEKNIQAKIDKFDKVTVESEKLINTKISTFESSFTTAQNNFKNNIEQSTAQFNEVIGSAQKELQEAREIKEEAKNFTVKKLVERYGSIFSTQANDNYKYARKSLVVFIVTLVCAICLTLYFFIPLLGRIENLSENNITESFGNKDVSSTTPILTNEIDDSVTIEYLIVYIISRLTILGLLLVILKESLKNYNVNMHLYNINLHRQHSLESFDMLVANTSQHETRDLIIKELAQTIYGNQESGYLSNSDKKTVSVAQVTELIKALK